MNYEYPNTIATIILLVIIAFRFLFKLALIVIAAAAATWVVLSIVDRWDEPEYPHSGFAPDCPVYVEQ